VRPVQPPDNSALAVIRVIRVIRVICVIRVIRVIRVICVIRVIRVIRMICVIRVIRVICVIQQFFYVRGVKAGKPTLERRHGLAIQGSAFHGVWM
jgi:hypothetical protein